MASYWEHLDQLVSAETPFVVVTLVDVMASAPGTAGAKILVTEEGLKFGTIGGGSLEMKTLAEAKAMLADGGGGGARGAAAPGPGPRARP